MASAYNERVIQDLIIDGLAPLGRGGQTRLAEAVGVRVQTVNKWVKRQTCPDPAHWPAIEAFFGFERGEIVRRSWPEAAGGDELLTKLTGISAHSGIDVLDTLTAEELEEVLRFARSLRNGHHGSGQ